MHCSTGEPKKPNNYSKNNYVMPGGNMTRNKHPATHVGPEKSGRSGARGFVDASAPAAAPPALPLRIAASFFF